MKAKMKKKNDSKSPADLVRPVKAYKNAAFLNSPDARTIRVLCEFVEPHSRFRKQHVGNTVVFFGSARTLPATEAQNNLRELERSSPSGPKKKAAHEKLLSAARRDVRMSRYYEDARALARRLTEWSLTISPPSKRFVICSGGGPGIMDAANRGAADAGGKSVGLNISLPFEQTPNEHQTPDLSFEFHYFFIRKFWFVYLAKALAVFPGGFGTMDELFELLTLIQTGKTHKYMPIVVYGSEFWRDVIDFDALVERGVISPEDMDLLRFCDTVDEAFDYLKDELTEYYLNGRKKG